MGLWSIIAQMQALAVVLQLRVSADAMTQNRGIKIPMLDKVEMRRKILRESVLSRITLHY
ncbi:MAG: hypothetical protein CMP81_17740 [Fulvimarina sp.]|nr:hypothetical protein [Fulvimarina sp.]